MAHLENFLFINTISLLSQRFVMNMFCQLSAIFHSYFHLSHSSMIVQRHIFYFLFQRLALILVYWDLFYINKKFFEAKFCMKYEVLQCKNFIFCSSMHIRMDSQIGFNKSKNIVSYVVFWYFVLVLILAF